MTPQELMDLKDKIADCDYLLVGLGEEWNSATIEDYNKLYSIIRNKVFFVVTTVTNGVIFQSEMGETEGLLAPVKNIVAPCGNVHWRQCKEACTHDIWEEGELPDEICPHCGAPLVENTVKAEHYIEEGYLQQWKVYTEWLSRTMSRKLLMLELGVGFDTPTVIRWPFEKTAFFNLKSYLYRINEKFPQLTEDVKARATALAESSVEVIRQV